MKNHENLLKSCDGQVSLTKEVVLAFAYENKIKRVGPKKVLVKHVKACWICCR